jgi:hypothetical protein
LFVGWDYWYIKEMMVKPMKQAPSSKSPGEKVLLSRFNDSLTGDANDTSSIRKLQTLLIPR